VVSLPKLRKSEKDKRRGAGQWAVAWRRFKKHKSGLFGLALIIALLIIALFNNYIAAYPARPSPDAYYPLYHGEAGQPPSWAHIFGTTIAGTDVLSDVIHSSVYTVYVAVIGTLITIFLVVLVGVISGYLTGIIDDVIMRITEIFLVFPALLLILVFARVYEASPAYSPSFSLGPIVLPAGLTLVIIIVSIFSWAGYARVIRGEVMKIRESEYVQAAKGLGARSSWIMTRHIVPNILPQIIVIATLTMASIVLTEAAVTFLGFGDPNTVTWGSLMQENLSYMSSMWWAVVFPGLGIFLTVLAFNLLGDGLADAINPRLRE
jgi:ABC-type dipeptide/oligopeptide/nickel transport system permease subunit